MKESIQKFGRFLSGMVMPNIGAFIAWGIITALFIKTGYSPNEKISAMVDPMLKYMLPILIGYTGGNMVYGKRGAVVGTIATTGVLVGADIPMFIGAMVMGPVGGWVIKKFDEIFNKHIPAGFEMLVNNFSSGILGCILAIIGCLGINPICVAITTALGSGVQLLVDNSLLPLTSLLVEPAKVLFLNNAINHGVFTPLGAEQALETGKSIFFLIESNPGPGLGLLLAYTFVGKGMSKASAPGAMIIHFIGGIHEIYFPYVMMNPFTIIALIVGGASGVFVNVLFNSGLVAPASPGSIIAIMSMCERSSYLGVILSIVVATVVSCLVAIFILKLTNKDEVDLQEAQKQVMDMKSNSKIETKETKIKEESNTTINLIVFACDAGMGSSAMGATTLTKKLKAEGIDIKVEHYAIDEIPLDTQVVVTQKTLVQRTASRVPDAVIFPITNFMGGSEYDEIIKQLKTM